jgi:ABC-type siderophore export system fused ATPase/permease subunit
MFRLFEELAETRDAKLFNRVVKVLEGSKELTEKNGYQWLVFEDFYNVISYFMLDICF